MYPGEGMYVDDQPVHRHHLPITDDDDDDDDNNDNNHHHHHHNNHDHDHNPYAGNQHHNHPPRNTPPPSRHHQTPPKRTRTPTPTATPQLRPQQPLQPPTPLNPPQHQQQQQLQPPTPLRPPVQLQPPTPLPPQPPLQFQPTPQLQQRPPPDSPPTPRKPHQPPPMDLNHPHHYNDGDDEDKYPLRQLGAVVFILLLLFGLTALILWLIYRPTKPQFTAVATLIYSLNTTVTSTAAFDGAPATVAASMQFVIHTRNPNKRTTLTYDHLAATVYYRNTAITPPVALPPLYHRKKSSVIIAPVIGGPPPAVAIPVAAEVAEELAANEAYGVIGFSWVVVGRVRYRAGGFKSRHSRVYVRCDVVVRLNGVNNGVYINPGGQVPLLASPPCLVDI